MKHPVALGLAIALALGLAWFVAMRHGADAPAGHGTAVSGVRVAEVWAASLPDLAGQPQPLKQWQGKVLVLNFWAPWCPPCREEMPGFVRLQEKYAAQGLQFVGVALDEAAKVEAFVDETGVSYPILLGDMAAVSLGQAAGNRLGGLPYTLILDRQGNPVEGITGGLAEARLEAIVKPLL